MRGVQRVYIAHTINTVAQSIISVYVPAYLLTIGFPLWRVVFFYAIVHGFGLLFGLFGFTFLVQKWGVFHTFKLYYPLQILYLLGLSLLKITHIPPEAVALVSGIATFSYWIPMNIFFVKQAEGKEMGSALSKFFALPNLFGILGPILGAFLIPTIGFWPVFVMTAIGLIASFLPLTSLKNDDMYVHLNLTIAWERLKRNKTIFLFEYLDNIIEESEWFWGIYVFVIIGSLATPGIVGSLQAIGGAVFTLFIGKYANKHAKKMIPAAAMLLLILTLFRVFTQSPFSAYLLTIVGAFALNLFLVCYFSTIFKTIKNGYEEEFMVLREIPTVLGRMTVFAMILLALPYLRFFFFLPLFIIAFLIALYLIKRSVLQD